MDGFTLLKLVFGWIYTTWFLGFFRWIYTNWFLDEFTLAGFTDFWMDLRFLTDFWMDFPTPRASCKAHHATGCRAPMGRSPEAHYARSLKSLPKKSREISANPPKKQRKQCNTIKKTVKQCKSIQKQQLLKTTLLLYNLNAKNLLIRMTQKNKHRIIQS